jgi:hypothetical protein
MEAKTVWKFEVRAQPLMVVNVLEGSNDLSPVRNTFAALSGVPNDGAALQHQHVDPLFCKALCSSGTCRTRPYDNDLPVFNGFHCHLFHLKHAVLSRNL